MCFHSHCNRNEVTIGDTPTLRNAIASNNVVILINPQNAGILLLLISKPLGKMVNPTLSYRGMVERCCMMLLKSRNMTEGLGRTFLMSNKYC